MYVAVAWYGDDSPHLHAEAIGATSYGGCEQARPLKTVKVHIPIAEVGYGSDRRFSSWETMTVGSLSTGSRAGHLTENSRWLNVQSGLRKHPVNLCGPRASVASGQRRLLKRGKSRSLRMSVCGSCLTPEQEVCGRCGTGASVRRGIAGIAADMERSPAQGCACWTGAPKEKSGPFHFVEQQF